MTESLTKILRTLMRPFFQLLAALVVLLVGVSVYTLYAHVQDSPTTGFFTTPNVQGGRSPSDPFALSATSGTVAGAIQLTWASVPRAVEYRVFRLDSTPGTPCGSGTLVLRIATGIAPAFTEAAPPGTVRRYQVQAEFNDGSTACSLAVHGLAG